MTLLTLFRSVFFKPSLCSQAHSDYEYLEREIYKHRLTIARLQGELEILGEQREIAKSILSASRANLEG